MHKPRKELRVHHVGPSGTGGNFRGVNRNVVFAYYMAKEGNRRTNKIALIQFAIKLIGT